MPIRLPTRAQVDRQGFDALLGEIPEASVQPGDEYYALTMLVTRTVWGVYQPLRYVSRQQFPRSADEVWLAEHARLRAIDRGQPSAAAGLFLLTGTAGAVQPAGNITQGVRTYTIPAMATLATPAWASTLVTAYDAQYQDIIAVGSTAGMAADDPCTVVGMKTAIRRVLGPNAVMLYSVVRTNPVGLLFEPTSGYAAMATCTAVGEDGNLAPGTACSLDSPAMNVDGTCLALLVAGGASLEDPASWARRIEYAMAEYPAGGNRSQVVGWCTGTLTREDRDAGVQAMYALGVRSGFAYPLFRLKGTWDAVVRGAGGTHLTPAIIAGVQAYTAQQIAMGADGLVTDFTDATVDVTLDLYGHPGYEPDWLGTFTLTTGGTTVRLPTTTSPVGVVAQGDRVALHQGGMVYVGICAAVDASGFTLLQPLPVVPTAGSIVRPGSAIVAPSLAALQALFKALTPGDTVPPSRWPPLSAVLPAELPTSLIQDYVMAVQGMRHVAVVLPATNQVPGPKVQYKAGIITLRHQP